MIGHILEKASEVFKTIFCQNLWRKLSVKILLKEFDLMVRGGFTNFGQSFTFLRSSLKCMTYHLWISVKSYTWYPNKTLFFKKGLCHCPLKRIKILESWANPRKGLPLNLRGVKMIFFFFFSSRLFSFFFILGRIFFLFF